MQQLQCRWRGGSHPDHPWPAPSWEYAQAAQFDAQRVHGADGLRQRFAQAIDPILGHFTVEPYGQVEAFISHPANGPSVLLQPVAHLGNDGPGLSGKGNGGKDPHQVARGSARRLPRR